MCYSGIKSVVAVGTSRRLGRRARQVRIPHRARCQIMKQSTLNFSAAKRTASTGKPKISSTPFVKHKAPPAKALIQKKESSEDDIDDYDDIVLRDSSSEEIESVDSKASGDDATEISKEKLVSSGETLARTTRLRTKTSLPSVKTKPGREQEEAASQPFKTLNHNPDDLQRKDETVNDSLPELDPSSRKWNKLHSVAKAKLGGLPSMIPSFIIFGFISIDELLISPRKGR